MKRYQVYLDPNDVAVLDEFQEHSDFSRSKIIRQAVKKAAEQISKYFVSTHKSPKETTLDKLIGSIDLGIETNYASDDDSIYLRK